MAVNTRVPILAVILSAGCLVLPLQAQIPVRDCAVLEGPWECRNSVGIHGVFVAALTYMTEKGGQQDTTSQGISVRVYERLGDKSARHTFPRVVIPTARLFWNVNI